MTWTDLYMMPMKEVGDTLVCEWVLREGREKLEL